MICGRKGKQRRGVMARQSKDVWSFTDIFTALGKILRFFNALRKAWEAAGLDKYDFHELLDKTDLFTRAVEAIAPYLGPEVKVQDHEFFSVVNLSRHVTFARLTNILSSQGLAISPARLLSDQECDRIHATVERPVHFRPGERRGFKCTLTWGQGIAFGFNTFDDVYGPEDGIPLLRGIICYRT